MAAYGKTDTMIVHTADPLNAETSRAALAEHDLTPADRFYVRNHGSVPDTDPAAWTLRIDGLVEQPLTLSLDDLRGLQRREVAATLQCAGNRRSGLLEVRDIPGEEPWGPGATGTATWGGVALADVLALARPTGTATHVGLVGADVSEEAEPPQEFGGSIRLEKALREEVLLAFEMNGELLPPVHGAPVRVVVPGYIGARSVKWLHHVEVRDRPWEGWFQDVVYRLLQPEQEPGPGVGMPLGEVALNAEILVPDHDARVTAGPVAVRGYAFAGGERHVARVDVSADGGKTWVEADLDEDLGRWAWRLWSTEMHLDRGDHEIVVRAWDSAAASQPEHPGPLWNPKGYVNNAWGRVTLHVA
ncbi:sulfite oxidase [Patulibacter sp. NPDC049589]|jgi:sulfite oxidase|uniref:sulfite oxidase n=1 Tax=Patulibacter sp. NPDC049589 TaxID=3154731 RepID=UPI003445D99E